MPEGAPADKAAGKLRITLVDTGLRCRWARCKGSSQNSPVLSQSPRMTAIGWAQRTSTGKALGITEPCEKGCRCYFYGCRQQLFLRIGLNPIHSFLRDRSPYGWSPWLPPASPARWRPADHASQLAWGDWGLNTLATFDAKELYVVASGLRLS